MRVRAENNQGNATWSDVITFTTRTETFPGAVTFLYPIMNSVNVATRVPCSWTTSANSLRYRLQTATDASFANLTKNLVVHKTDTVIQVKGGKTIYLRVRGENDIDRGNWTIINFQTQPNTPPTVPEVISPGLETGINLGDPVVFKWNSTDVDDDTLKFKLHIYNNEFDTTIFDVKSPYNFPSEKLDFWKFYWFDVIASDGTVEVQRTHNYLFYIYQKSNKIYLSRGWNIISINMIPNNLNIATLFEPLIVPGFLVKVQDESGNSLENWGVFGGWTNNIGNVSLIEGYKVKVKLDYTLEIMGASPVLPFQIPLKTGWNIIGYPKSSETNAKSVVQQLIDRGTLVKAQDESGNSLEDWGIFGGWTNNIGNFMPGKGYKVKVATADTLTIY